MSDEILATIKRATDATTGKKEAVQLAVKELTAAKINEAEKRIIEIDRKIEKLQKEKENLLRKNENRRKSLLERD